MLYFTFKLNYVIAFYGIQIPVSNQSVQEKSVPAKLCQNYLCQKQSVQEKFSAEEMCAGKMCAGEMCAGEMCAGVLKMPYCNSNNPQMLKKLENTYKILKRKRH